MLDDGGEGHRQLIAHALKDRLGALDGVIGLLDLHGVDATKSNAKRLRLLHHFLEAS